MSTQRLPVIVYLHGIGESGGDTTQVRRHGPWKGAPLNARVIGCLREYFLIAPHLENRNEHWDPLRLVETLRVAFSEIARRNLATVDAERIYVTGNSRGGRGALELALRGFPDPHNASWDSSKSEGLPFKAAAIVCPEQGAKGGAAERLRDRTQYQFFHRANDANRPTRGTYQQFAGTANAAFHVYDGCNHNCWSATYASPALYEWFDNPAVRPRWGSACDFGMCAETAEEVIEVKKSIKATFCPRHAGEYKQYKWIWTYITKLENVP